MNTARILMIGSAIAAFSVTGISGAYAQTTQPMQPQTMQPQTMQPTEGTPGVMPQPQTMVAPAPTDPLVQKRNANAQANAEYSASKKASKGELKAQNQQAKAQ